MQNRLVHRAVRLTPDYRYDLEQQVVAAVKDFARAINSGSKGVAEMSALVQVTSEPPLSNLEGWERVIRVAFSSVRKPSPWLKWAIWSKPSQPLTWLDLISGDGYRREKALRTLSGAAPNRFFLALAMRRLNDWVPQVRVAARERLPHLIKRSNPIQVVDLLCVILPHWHSWGRIEQQDKLGLLESICHQQMAGAIKSKLISSTSGPMLSLLAQVGRTAVLDEYLSEIAEKAVQPWVRAKAYRSQFEGRMVWVEMHQWQWTDPRYCGGGLRPTVAERTLAITFPFLATLKQASADRSPIVRRVAAEFLIREWKTLGEASLPLAKHFASDPSPSVAERGRFVLKKLEASEE